ncbi:MAG: endopeptidase La [Deltaproteobacteria bacterium]|nr:endopeptidase La [Deltaproteobacteria bacterium]
MSLPLLKLDEVVLFPGAALPLQVGGAGIALVDAVKDAAQPHVLVATARTSGDVTRLEDLHPIATLASLSLAGRAGSGRRNIVLTGIERRRLTALEVGALLRAESEPVLETGGVGAEAEAMAESLRSQVAKVLALASGVDDQATQALAAAHEPGKLADLAAILTEAPVAERAAVLAELDVVARGHAVLNLLAHRIQVLLLKNQIDSQVFGEISKQQREHVLRKQMKAIQEELGEDGGEDGAHDELADKIVAAGMPEDVAKVARKQLGRLRSMQSGSAEYQVGRTYLELLCDLPWSRRSEAKVDLAAARASLEAEHHGLDKVKKRILEYLAVRKLSPSKKGPILCLAGPPGVGKTSLGKSIAAALGRDLTRVSLGGVRDEAAIRGHRRTYVGALPGRIIDALKKVGSKNPVMVLDELDKLGNDLRGDPAAALLEVLDPEQNNSFTDHYLEVPFDLSEVVFLATANDLGSIPGPLRDRLEIIELPGYPTAEKRVIAERHLWPKQLREHGLTEAQASITTSALTAIIEGYTREAGVRNLERELAAVARAIAVKVVSSSDASGVEVVDADDLARYLGPARFESDIAERTGDPGVATGLAWTPNGGEILFIEASRSRGTGKLTVTGQLGEVMKESAQAALSYVRSHAAAWGIPAEAFERHDLHIHVPQGGVPKDGPSAGNALVSAIMSLYTGRRVRGDVAMTGEITLRGAVLPVGGIQSKVLAAHRAGIRRVVLPERNRRDLIEIPADVKADLEIILVKRIEETLAATLEPVLVPTIIPVPAGPGNQAHVSAA